MDWSLPAAYNIMRNLPHGISNRVAATNATQQRHVYCAPSQAKSICGRGGVSYSKDLTKKGVELHQKVSIDICNEVQRARLISTGEPILPMTRTMATSQIWRDGVEPFEDWWVTEGYPAMQMKERLERHNQEHWMFLEVWGRINGDKIFGD